MTDKEKPSDDQFTNENLEAANTGNCAPGWYLENIEMNPGDGRGKGYPVRQGNNYEIYYSGEKIFTAVADSIENAKDSVDIVLWGFDPAMPVRRTESVYKMAIDKPKVVKINSRKLIKTSLKIIKYVQKARRAAKTEREVLMRSAQKYWIKALESLIAINEGQGNAFKPFSDSIMGDVQTQLMGLAGITPPARAPAGSTPGYIPGAATPPIVASSLKGSPSPGLENLTVPAGSTPGYIPGIPGVATPPIVPNGTNASSLPGLGDIKSQMENLGNIPLPDADHPIYKTMMKAGNFFDSAIDWLMPKNEQHSGWRKEDAIGHIILKSLRKNPDLKIRIVIWYDAFSQRLSKNVIGMGGILEEKRIPRDELSTGFSPLLLNSDYFTKKEPPEHDIHEYARKPEEQEVPRYLDRVPLRDRHPDAQAYSLQWFQHVAWGAFLPEEIGNVDYENTDATDYRNRLEVVFRRYISSAKIIDELLLNDTVLGAMDIYFSVTGKMDEISQRFGGPWDRFKATLKRLPVIGFIVKGIEAIGDAITEVIDTALDNIIQALGIPDIHTMIRRALIPKLDDFMNSEMSYDQIKEMMRELGLDNQAKILESLEIEDEDINPVYNMTESIALMNASDHQKMILVDYETDSPHGYIMGHNMLTNYWSAFPFVHRDPRNEMDYAPYHDFSLRLTGPLLVDLNDNFCQAWEEHREYTLQQLIAEKPHYIPQPRGVPSTVSPDKKPVYTRTSKPTPQELEKLSDEDRKAAMQEYERKEDERRQAILEPRRALRNARKTADENILSTPSGSSCGQVVRTLKAGPRDFEGYNPDGPELTDLLKRNPADRAALLRRLRRITQKADQASKSSWAELKIIWEECRKNKWLFFNESITPASIQHINRNIVNEAEFLYTAWSPYAQQGYDAVLGAVNKTYDWLEKHAKEEDTSAQTPADTPAEKPAEDDKKEPPKSGGEQVRRDVKAAYMQAARNARHYMLIVNQYCQYARLAREIKKWRKNPIDKGLTDTLYIFMGTCKPEQPGQVFAAQQMANELGVGVQFTKAEDEIYIKPFPSQSGQNGQGGKGTEGGQDGASAQSAPFDYTEGRGDSMPEAAPNADGGGGEASTTTPAQPRQTTQDGRMRQAGTHVPPESMASEFNIKTLFFMFYTQIPETGRDRVDKTAQQPYVHAKLLAEDDVFFTLGSTNLNIRSMAVDSELNLISTNTPIAQGFRYELLNTYFGYDNTTDEGEEKNEFFPNMEYRSAAQRTEYIQEDLKAIFSEAREIAKDNRKKITKEKRIQGYIATFEDDRTALGMRVG